VKLCVFFTPSLAWAGVARPLGAQVVARRDGARPLHAVKVGVNLVDVRVHARLERAQLPEAGSEPEVVMLDILSVTV